MLNYMLGKNNPVCLGETQSCTSNQGENLELIISFDIFCKGKSAERAIPLSTLLEFHSTINNNFFWHKDLSILVWPMCDFFKGSKVQSYLFHCRPKKYTMKGAKRYYALLRDTQIYFYKSESDINQNSLHRIHLKGKSLSSYAFQSVGMYVYVHIRWGKLLAPNTYWSVGLCEVG